MCDDCCCRCHVIVFWQHCNAVHNVGMHMPYAICYLPQRIVCVKEHPITILSSHLASTGQQIEKVANVAVRLGPHCIELRLNLSQPKYKVLKGYNYSFWW